MGPTEWCSSPDAHGYKCKGHTLKTVTGISTHSSCYSACTDYGDACLAWTWYYPTQECMLKSSCNNVTASAQYHSSWPRTGPAPTPAPAPTPTPAPTPAPC